MMNIDIYTDGASKGNPGKGYATEVVQHNQYA